MRLKWIALALPLVGLHVMAHAESYALLDLNGQPSCSSQLPSCSDDVVLPQATLQGGFVRSEGTYNSYAVQGEVMPQESGEDQRRTMKIFISPSFAVSEMRFNLFSAPNPSSDIEIFAFNSDNQTIATADFVCDTYVCQNTVDLHFSGSLDVLYLSDYGNDFAYDYSLDHIELNPSLAPSAVTPEPASLTLAATGVFGLVSLALLRKVKITFAA